MGKWDFKCPVCEKTSERRFDSLASWRTTHWTVCLECGANVKILGDDLQIREHTVVLEGIER